MPCVLSVTEIGNSLRAITNASEPRLLRSGSSLLSPNSLACGRLANRPPMAFPKLKSGPNSFSSARMKGCLASALLYLLAALVVVGNASAQTVSQPAVSAIQDLISKGQEQYKGKQYQESILSFEEAIRLDQKNIEAKLGLANACMRLWARGSKSPTAENNYFRARNTLLEVLDLEPDNKKALSALSRMSLERTNFTVDRKALNETLDEARTWNLRLVAIDPNDATAHYALGVISWTRCLGPESQSHNLAIVKRADPDVPLEVQARLDYRAACQGSVEEGIWHLKQALEIEKDNDASMGYLGALYKMKASYEDSPEEAEHDRQSSQEWTAKAEAARKTKAATGDAAQPSR